MKKPSDAPRVPLTEGKRPIRYMQQSAVLLLAILGLLFSLVSCYQLTVLTSRAVIAALIGVVLFSVVFAFRKHGWIPLTLCLAAASVYVLTHYAPLLQGLLLLIDQAIMPLSLEMPAFLLDLLSAHDALEATRLATDALIALLFAATFLASLFSIRHISVLGLALATLPLLLPAPFYGLSPAVAPFFCLVAAYMMLYLLHSGMHMAPSLSRSGGESTMISPEPEQLDQRPAQRLIALFALPLVALAALLALTVLPEKDYVRPEKIDALQERILSLGSGSNPFKSNDGLTHGDLRQLSSIRFSGETALKVRISEQKALYLRDFAGTLLSEGGWVSVPADAYQSYADYFAGIAPLNLYAAAAALRTSTAAPYTVSIKNVSGARGSLWVPNGLMTHAEEIENATSVQDTAYGAAHKNVPAYTVVALPIEPTLYDIPLSGAAPDASAMQSAYTAAAGAALGLPGADSAEAQRVKSAADAYIDYIFAAYTTLPEDTRQAANALCKTYGLKLYEINGSLSTLSTCRDLYQLLTSRCSYAYSPPATPAGVDFTTYFLEESRSGYCVHFATAATVLLRSLGIPARYAEGYIVVSSDYDKAPDEEGYIAIEDTHAHAWVEVFDPAQLEWIPLEMTASDSDGGASAPNEPAQGTPSPTPSPTPTPSPSPTPEPTSTPGATPSPGENAEESLETPTPDETGSSPTPDSAEGLSPAEESPTPAPGLPDAADEPEPSANNGSDTVKDPNAPGDPLIWPFLIPLGLALLIFAAFFWRRTLWNRRKQSFRGRNINASVLALIRLSMDMLLFFGCAPMQSLDTPASYADSVLKTVAWLDSDKLRSLLTLAQRARFSGSVCIKADRNEALAFARALRADAAAHLPRLKRYLFLWKFPKL